MFFWKRSVATTAAAAPAVAPTIVNLPLRGQARPDLLRDELLCEIFAESARRWPERVCMVHSDGTLTYAEVEARATGIARGLLREGIQHGHVVGLWMARGPDPLIAQIAIAMTGATWLPFDAEAPVARIGACVGDASARFLLTDEGRLAELEGRVDCDVVCARDLVDDSDTTAVDARALGATPDSLAYLIYTSGSTGAPKGIAIANRNACHLLRAVSEVYGLGADDRMFQGASIAFDLSVEEIWLPWLVGASLFVATADEIADVEALPALMERHGVTALDTVPTLLSLLPRDVATLRTLILGGEACPQGLVDQWSRPGRNIFNTYGPTETTVVATIARLSAGDLVTIGEPIPNYTCHVVDSAMRPVGLGIEGELLIGGPGVARGYIARDELTAEKFIANPFESDGHDPVLYRSGDAVSVDAEGRIHFRGRLDDQIKIRGFRVELGEIEARLRKCLDVSSAAVVARQENGVDHLIAFVATPKQPDLWAVRQALGRGLPAYMIPSRIERVDALPLLPSGKVDRNRLKAMGGPRA